MTPLGCILTGGHTWVPHYSTRIGRYLACSRCVTVTYPGPREGDA